MFSPLTGKLPASSASTNILAALQRPNDKGVEPPSFSSMLQQTNHAPWREPGMPHEVQKAREPARSEARAVERQPSPSQPRADSPARPDEPREAQKATTGREPERTSQADDTASSASERAVPSSDGAESSADADEGEAASAAASVAAAPASLAELSAIIAALAGMHGNKSAAEGMPAETSPAETTEGSDGTLAGIEAAIDKLPKQLQAAARALLGLPAEQPTDTAEAAPADPTAKTPGLALQPGEEPPKDAKAPTLASSAAQPASVAQLASATPNQAQQVQQPAAMALGNGGELAAASALAQGARAARAEAQPVQQLPVFTPAGNKAWAEDVGNRLIWMANRSESRAELVLTPPSLGKLGVSIQVSGDQTTAQFVAATPAAREALEQAMPRLRELMQQAGINLGQTDVSTSPEQQARDNQGDGRDGPRRGGSPLPGATEVIERASSQSLGSGLLGLVDTFA